MSKKQKTRFIFRPEEGGAGRFLTGSLSRKKGFLSRHRRHLNQPRTLILLPFQLSLGR